MSAEFQLIHLRDYEPVSAECLKSLPESLIRKQLIVPLAFRNGRLLAAAPGTQGLLKPEGLHLVAHCPVDVVTAPADEIIDFIRRHYPDAIPMATPLTVIHPDVAVPTAPVEPVTPTVPVASVPRAAFVAPPAPVVPVAPVEAAQPIPPATPKPVLGADEVLGCPVPLRRLMSEAVANRAREVLLERDGSLIRLRHRIRGVLVTDLREKLSLKEAAEAFTYVVEQGDAQSDGGVRWADMQFEATFREEIYVCRVVVSETKNFSMLSAQLSPVRERTFDPVDWGMGPHQARTLENFLARRQGMILFCSSETDDFSTTMHACLRPMVTPERHVIAVQGRREERLPGVEQLLSHGDSALFGRHLQVAFRHAPDIVLAKPLERRDHVETCLSEALSGRLILAGLNASDVADAVRQILAMGVEPYVLSSAVMGVVAQRALRLNCPRCQEKDPVDREQLKNLGIPLAMQPTSFFRGRGCEACLGTGFDRETSLFEILEFNDTTRGHFQKDAGPDSLRALFHAGGMMTLRQIALHKAINGQTSLAEVLRTTV